MTTYHDPGSGRTPGPTRLIWILLAVVSIAALQLGSSRTYVTPYDEGLILYGAARVANGGTPYLDFWSMYGPGSFYALAGLDRLFGESVLTGRAFDAATRACAVVLVFFLVRRHSGRTVALGCATCVFLALICLRQYLFPALPATASILLALLALPHLPQHSSHPRNWFLPGAAAGVTLLFRHDFGLCAIAACLWVLWDRPRGTLRRGFIAKALVAFASGVLIVAGPLYGWLIASVPGATLFEDLVSIPIEVYASNRSLPFPHPMAVVREAYAQQRIGGLSVLLVYVPLLGVFMGFAAVAMRRTQRRPPADAYDRPTRRVLEATLIVLVLLTIKGTVRVEVVHMFPALLVCVVLVGLMLSNRREESALVWRRAVSAVAALGIIATASGLWWSYRTVHAGGVPSALALAKLAHCDATRVARLGCFSLEPNLLAVLQYLGAHARPGDGLYVGAGRHDKLLMSNVELYFLSGLPAVTRWVDTHPGVQTTARVQRLMIADMQRRPPAFVVLNTTWDDANEPNASRLSSGVTLLDDYLSTHYTAVFHAGKLSVNVPRETDPS